MRTVPDGDSDREELERLNAEPWMVEALSLNPEYVFWGPDEDYMMGPRDGQGWNAPQRFDTWKAFGPWTLDELNECVHFYFEIRRESKQCKACGQTGYNPATREIADTFYDHGSYRVDFLNWKIEGDAEAARRPGGATGRRWCDKITDDELKALQAGGRFCKAVKRKDGQYDWVPLKITAEQVNAAERGDKDARQALGGSALCGHDAINRSILIKARATRLGVYGLCPDCEGHGYVYTAPKATLALVLWWLHPRKGCSREVEIKSISKREMPTVAKFLAAAAKRNAERFSKIAALAGEVYQ